jgi:hypothetical protein
VAGASEGPSELEAELGEVAGIEIVLCGVELTVDTVVIHLRARQSAVTEALDAAHRTALLAWEHELGAAERRGERPPDPPAQPGSVLNAIALRLQDDAKTSYRWLGSQAGGTGSEWDAIWRFGPQPPPEATRLSVTIDGTTAGYSLQL